MTYQPVVPMGGPGGWAFLNRTREAQTAAFDRAPAITRDTAYFEEKIGSITTAEELVADRRLLRVALGAFGLDSEIDAKFFVRKVLEEGTISGKGLANRLSDTRYFELAEKFAFDLTPPNTVLSTFGAEITALYRERQFEAAVGNVAPDMRLALSLDRELGGLVDRELSDTASWYMVLATPPLRTVFEKALAIPPAVAAADVDRQFDLFREKAASVLGVTDFSQFGDEGVRDKLRQSFLARSDSQVLPQATGRGSAALAILQGGGFATGLTGLSLR